MTKCLFKALKAVDLDQHVELFRSLGYDSAGALACFRAEHFEKLNFNEQELLRLIALLDVLKEATREGKICPHHFNSSKTTKRSATVKSVPIQAMWSDDACQLRNSQAITKKPSNDSATPRGYMNSIGFTACSSSATVPVSKTTKSYSNDAIFEKASTVLSRSRHLTPAKIMNQRYTGPKPFSSRPAVQHVKVKSYNYGVPNGRRSKPSSSRTNQYSSNLHHGSIFVSSPSHGHDSISYAKPAEIFVYARKRPLLPSECNFQDSITVPDNKRIIVAESKANLDCTPLLKKTEFEYDQVFGPDASNKYVFDTTVLPFITAKNRPNLTYICFGQTGSGKSHTIFGSKNTDGLLVHCTQLLLQEINFENKLVCSFYEIYNNQVYDLFNSGKRLFVREDGEHHVNVIGANEVTLQNLDGLRCAIDNGLMIRHHGKSAFNSNSSRSHAIFQVVLRNNYDSSESFRLVFIDLAGSERATDAQNNQRQTRREGAQINWSLLALKECIRSMDMIHSHAPFRQSKLTHILRDSLTGSQTQTCLMANVSPPDDCCQCSLNTLQYASRIRDISMRHRHRSAPTVNAQMSCFDDTVKEAEVFREKSQRPFKPTTASTPVHRLTSSVDQRAFPFSSQTDMNIRTKKPANIDWQLADDDVPIIGGSDNLRLKSLLTSSSREFALNVHSNNEIHNNKHHVNRLQQKKSDENNDGLSSYFPQPQTNLNSSSFIKVDDTKRPYGSARLLFQEGNDRQMKSVPTPSTSRHSSSINESVTTAKVIPITNEQQSDENPYASVIDAENLGAKLTKTTGPTTSQYSSSTTRQQLVEDLKPHKKYDPTAIIADIDQVLRSDQQGTERDQADFFANRHELLAILSSRLAAPKQRSSSVTTPRSRSNTSQHTYQNSTYSSKSKNTPLSASKTRQKPHSIKSASSAHSLTNNARPEKKSTVNNKKSKVTPSAMNFQKFHPTTRTLQNHQQHQRTVPLRVQHEPDSDARDKIHHVSSHQKVYSPKATSYSRRNEAFQAMKNSQITMNEKEQTDDYLSREPASAHYSHRQSTPSLSPKSLSKLSPRLGFMQGTLSQVPYDQMKFNFNFTQEEPTSLLSPTNLKSHGSTFASYSSPSKDFGLRVSEQLNALRSLLETRLTEPEETKPKKKESSVFEQSSDMFNQELLHSYGLPSSNIYSREYLNDVHMDDREIRDAFKNNNNSDMKTAVMPLFDGDIISVTTPSSNQHGYSPIYSQQYEQIIQPNLSSLSDELNQAKVNFSVTGSSTPTITSNLAAKVDAQEARNLSSPTEEVHSRHSIRERNQTESGVKSTPKLISNPTSDNECILSENNSTLRNPFSGSTLNQSQSHSPIPLPPLNTVDVAGSANDSQNYSVDDDKANSFLAGSSFDALLNSLKQMREKDLGFVLSTGDDQLIPVAD